MWWEWGAEILENAWLPGRKAEGLGGESPARRRHYHCDMARDRELSEADGGVNPYF